MRIGIDTNLLVYAELSVDDDRSHLASDLLYRLSFGDGVVTPQVMGEFFNVLTRKGGWSRSRARAAVHDWQSVLEVVYPDRETFASALDLAVDHNL